MSFERRAARARLLAERHPEARTPLAFYAAVADFQTKAAPSDFASLQALVSKVGPETLRETAREMDESAWAHAVVDYLSGRDRVSPRSFFARALLQVGDPPARGGGPEGGCSRCGHAPQAGVLRTEDDGKSLWLVCSLCFAEWRSPRGRCPACGEEDEKKLALYHAEEMAYAQVRACESCGRFLIAIQTELEPASIPDVDEMAALALSVWASEHGYRKIQPNLVGA